jgi:Tfp pilus assembly protein PilX
MKVYEKGQALVLVLLSLAVVLTLVLFILSRSVTDIAVSSREEEAVRAFSAAEAGVENALVVGVGSTSDIGNASFTANVSDFAVGLPSFVYPLSLSSGESGTVWFMGHNTDADTLCDATHPCFTGSSVKVCWGKEGTSDSTGTTPAIEFTLFYETTPGSVATARIARGVYDPNSSRRSSNSFAADDGAGCTIEGENFEFSKNISFASLGVPAGSYNVDEGLQFAKVRMFYNTDANHKIAFDVSATGNTLPSQGLKVSSSGVAGESNRRLEVFQGWPEAPSIFESVVFSSNGVTK